MPHRDRTDTESSTRPSWRSLLEDRTAISPVIGVILLVAVTVVLGSVVAVFAFTIGDSVNQPAPNAQVSFDYTDSTGTLVITHDGGDTITGENTGALAVKGSSDADVTAWIGDTSATGTEHSLDESLSSGVEITTIDVSSAGGQTVELVWESAGGSNSNTLGTYDIPTDPGTGTGPGGPSGSVGVSSTDDGDSTIGVTINP